MKNFYKNGMLEMIHELGNLVQKIICVSYELEMKDVDVTKLNHKVDLVRQMIKIYTGIYTQSTYSFQEMLETIESFHNHPISITYQDIEDLNNLESNAGLSRLVLAYSMWISKRYELEINIVDKKTVEVIVNENPEQVGKLYRTDKDNDSVYCKIVQSLNNDGYSCSIQGNKIVLSANE